MSSLIEGWFQLANGRSFVDNTPDTTTSPRKNKSYLSVFDSCAVLGSIPSEVFVESELRLYPGNHVLDKTVIHAHGRFAIVTADDDSDPSLQAEIHRFVIMDAINPSDDNTPEGLRTSVTLSGRVTAADAASGAGDKFFTLEVSDYVRDHTQTFSIRCRLNRTTSKRWENTAIPNHGTTVLISGYLDGESTAALRVEVETMQFITPARSGGGEGAGMPRTPGRSKFGMPVETKGKGSSPLAPRDKRNIKPLSALAIPTLPATDEAEAGPSTLNPAKRTRSKVKAEEKKTGKATAVTSAEPTTAEEDESPLAKKKQKTVSKA